MPDHPKDNPDLLKQHKVKQHEGDRELAGVNPDTPTPGKGKPDAQEGSGTQRRQG